MLIYIILLVLAMIFLISSLVMLRRTTLLLKRKEKEFSEQLHWYESALHAIPFPVSITDMNMKCTFINKPVEDMLGVKLANVKGKHCADVWKAAICNTPNCGINCLKKGELSTHFQQAGFDFKVDISYLHDENNKPIGHIEVVQNITELMQSKQQEKLIEAIQDTTHIFLEQAKQISDGAMNLADGATGQSAAIEELSASINDIREKTIDNSNHAKEAAEMSATITINAQSGSEKMGKMMEAVREIDESSKQIENVIKVIDSIASQTNLLSLNAAIEAARAGEAGRGFAVVAEEVRDLASKSAEAARDSGKLILSTVEKAQLGLEMAAETSDSLNEIVTAIKRNAAVIDDIAKSCETQVEAIGHLNVGIDEVAKIAGNTSSVAVENATISQEMGDQAERLGQLVKGK